ncbi:unnamed protein product [Closterium sp. NIES-64]|nr:unnamed protein product [Closterium sp. NIES-64]
MESSGRLLLQVQRLCDDGRFKAKAAKRIPSSSFPTTAGKSSIFRQANLLSLPRKFMGYEDRVPTLDITSALAEEVISPALVVLRGNRTCRVVAANSGEGRSICVHVRDEVYHATRSQFYANAEVVRVRQFNPLSMKRAFSNSYVRLDINSAQIEDDEGIVNIFSSNVKDSEGDTIRHKKSCIIFHLKAS